MAAQFSAFSSVALRFSSAPPPGEVIYESMRDSMSGKFSTSWDAIAQVRFYAMARAFGAAKEQLAQSGQESEPLKTQRLLSSLESDYLIVSSPNDSIDERRVALLAAFSVARGNTRDAIASGLRAILGSSYVGLYVSSVDLDHGRVPGLFPYSTPWPWLTIDTGIDPYNGSSASRKDMLLSDSIGAVAGSPQPFSVSLIGGSSALANGDKLTIIASPTRYETVTVSAATVGTTVTYSAVFSLPHAAGEFATTASMPVMGSYLCHLMIGVDSSVLSNGLLIDQVNRFMSRVAPCDMTWDISSGTGPFTVGDGSGNGGQLNVTPIGAIAYS